MKIIKTSFYISSAKKANISLENENALFEDLKTNPKKGDLIQKSGGLRKIRVATGNKGKSSGARVIYYYTLKNEQNEDFIYLFMAYAKNKKINLSTNDLKILKEILKEIK